MIYCVVLPELGEDVYNRLETRYRENPNVTVIWERRHAERRKRLLADLRGEGQRHVRDRRRRRLPGDAAL